MGSREHQSILWRWFSAVLHVHQRIWLWPGNGENCGCERKLNILKEREKPPGFGCLWFCLIPVSRLEFPLESGGSFRNHSTSSEISTLGTPSWPERQTTRKRLHCSIGTFCNFISEFRIPSARTIMTTKVYNNCTQLSFEGITPAKKKNCYMTESQNSILEIETKNSKNAKRGRYFAFKYFSVNHWEERCVQEAE